MLDEILPPCAVVVEAFDDTAEAILFPEEAAVVARAVDKRRREFATVRACARQALATLGIPAGPILPGPMGAPIWPAGIVGSMSHCAGYRGSAVARAEHLITLGIDAEEHAPLPPGVLDLVALPQERDQLRQLATADPDVCWDRLLFSIKESVYKAWFPLTRRWLGFHDAAVSADPASRSFAAQLLVPGPLVGGSPLTTFDGRWLVRGGLVLAAIAIPARPPTAGSRPAEQPPSRGCRPG